MLHCMNHLACTMPSLTHAELLRIGRFNPLRAIHVPIDTKTKRDDVLGLVNRIAALPSNSIVLVCWEHKVLKQIALALGVSDPPDYPSHVYDTEWTIMEHGEKMIKSQEGC